MELRQLRYLVALAEERHFTRAAMREHIAQPAISQQIRRLEQELGLTLVERSTRRVAITEAGELLVARARRILAQVEAARAELEGLRGVRSGHVTVGAMHTMGPIDVSLALAIFHQRHPGVELTVREQSSEELAEMLRVDELDLAFLSVTERIESHGLGLHQLVSEELVAILPKDHRLSTRRRVRMAELADDEFIAYRPGARLRELLIAAGRQAGYEPRVKLESNESQRIRRLVARGLGVAILPRSDAESPGAATAVAALVEPSLTRDITLAWRHGRQQPPAAAEFIELARVTFTQPGEALGCARSTASSRPGKRCSRSSRRSELRRVVRCSRCRITPASRSTRKWWVQVDFTTGSSKLLHVRSSPSASAATIRSRTGSLSACSTAASSISSRAGCDSASGGVSGSAVLIRGTASAALPALIVRCSSNIRWPGRRLSY